MLLNILLFIHAESQYYGPIKINQFPNAYLKVEDFKKLQSVALADHMEKAKDYMKILDTYKSHQLPKFHSISGICITHAERIDGGWVFQNDRYRIFLVSLADTWQKISNLGQTLKHFIALLKESNEFVRNGGLIRAQEIEQERAKLKASLLEGAEKIAALELQKNQQNQQIEQLVATTTRTAQEQAEFKKELKTARLEIAKINDEKEKAEEDLGLLKEAYKTLEQKQACSEKQLTHYIAIDQELQNLKTQHQQLLSFWSILIDSTTSPIIHEPQAVHTWDQLSQKIEKWVENTANHIIDNQTINDVYFRYTKHPDFITYIYYENGKDHLGDHFERLNHQNELLEFSFAVINQSTNGEIACPEAPKTFELFEEMLRRWIKSESPSIDNFSIWNLFYRKYNAQIRINPWLHTIISLPDSSRASSWEHIE